MKLCLVTQAYFDANEDLIRSIAAQAGVVNFQPIVAEGGLLRCRGLDPSLLLPPATIHEITAPTDGESQGGYRFRAGTETVDGFNAVKDGSKEVFYMPDEASLFECHAMSGWPTLI